MNLSVPTTRNAQALVSGPFAAKSALEMFGACVAHKKNQDLLQRFSLGRLLQVLITIGKMPLPWLLTKLLWPSADGRRLYGKRWRRKRLRDESRIRERSVIFHICHRNSLLLKRPSIAGSTMDAATPAATSPSALRLHLCNPNDKRRRNASPEMEMDLEVA